MNKAGLKPLLLDNLFKYGDKIGMVLNCNNLVLYTTGIHPEKLAPLMQKFNSIDFVPEVVIFMSEDTAMTFLDTARDLKSKGTQFYFVDSFNFNTLYPIVWI